MAEGDSIALLVHASLGEEEQTPWTLEYNPPPETQPCLLSPHLQTGAGSLMDDTEVPSRGQNLENNPHASREVRLAMQTKPGSQVLFQVGIQLQGCSSG